MKAIPLSLLFALLVAGCRNIVIEGQFLQPAEATATALAIPAPTVSTSGPDAATTIARAVRLTLTAAAPGPTNTPAAPAPTNTPAPSPDAFLIAFPENEAVEGCEWPEGSVVHLAIYDLTTAASPDFERDGVMAATVAGHTNVRFEFSTEYNLKVGDIVIVTDGATRRMHVVRNLSVVTVDAAADTVSGMADPGAPVDVWPGGFYPAALVQMTSGEDGAWRAALDGLFDLVPGSSGRSRILDGTGNSTAVDWLAPTPPSSATTEPTTAIASLALDQSTQASLSLQNPSSMAGRWQGGGISPSSRLTASSQEKQYEQCP